jgi:DNA-binding transcriptional regulator LsrR (DeoR family)
MHETAVTEDSHQELLARTAALYYEQEMTQNEIADRLGLSRVKVYRLLKEAREEQVVQIVINWPISRAPALEDDLKRSFGLEQALVLQSGQNDVTPGLRRLGQLSARYLEDILEDGMTMTVCLGRSTFEVVNAIRPGFRAHVNVAQAIGSLPFATPELDSAALARQLAQKLGGQVLYLSSPLVADNPEAATVLRSQRAIERTLKAARAASVALLGIGNMDPATSGFVKAGIISAEAMLQLAADGAIGDMAGQFITEDGKLHPCSYNQRVVGIRHDELRHIPNTIAVAMGLDKARAILGALRTKIINVLCTDDQSAREVLRLNELPTGLVAASTPRSPSAALA